MAGIGACYPCFAPFEGDEPESALPTYGEKVVLGKLVTANLTVNFAEASLDADDKMVEKVTEFSSGTIAMETDDMTDEVASAVYGAALDEETNELTNNTEDAAPFGGLTYYKSLIRNGKRYYKGYFYPKVQAVIGNDNAQTKGASITLQTTPTTFNILPPNVGDWRISKTFTTISEAKTWLDGKLSGTQSPVGG